MQPFIFFVSYRRQDTAPIALLIKNEIESRLQFVRVAVDVEEIGPGDEFPDRIKRLIDKAHVTIALIGKQWMPTRESTASGRAGDDWVVRELQYSTTAPLDHAKDDRYGLSQREVIPLFVDCHEGFNRFTIPKGIAYLKKRQGEHIDYAGWPSMIGPLLDRIARQFKVEKRQGNGRDPSPNVAKARTQPLAEAELAKILKYDDFNGWYVDNFGDADARYLAKTFEFRGFGQAAAFMELVSSHCKVLNHHPEWRNKFNYVTVALSTWDARRRVTIYDVTLALFMNKAAKVVAGK
jgi:pterin-4a-carbinolamine dehydratase